MKHSLHYIIIGIACLFLALQAEAARREGGCVSYTREDSITITRLLDRAGKEGGACLPLWFGRQLLGRPYVAATLELFPDQEQLIVNTRQLDCTTLVETVAALTICRQQGRTSFADYCTVLRQLRYRQGICQGYPSRLHYFSDWIDDNTRMGFVKEVQQAKAPFTAVQRLRIDYMQKHPGAYPSLKRHPEQIREIAVQEKALTGQSYRYIPKSEVRNTEALRAAVHDGDIIAITCNKPGLDIAHVGYAVWRKDGLHLLNASMIHKKAVIEPMTLGQYLAKHPSHTGIRVVRILDSTKKQ